MISVKRSASCGATRCHITWVSEKPCSNSSGGPLPPTRAKTRPDVVLIHSAAYPGNKSARSGMVISFAVMAGLVPAIHLLRQQLKVVDARHEAGHDDQYQSFLCSCSTACRPISRRTEARGRWIGAMPA